MDSLSQKTSYCQILICLEGARLGVRMIVLHRSSKIWHAGPDVCQNKILILKRATEAPVNLGSSVMAKMASVGSGFVKAAAFMALWHTHGSNRPGKVMEFNPWLEKSLNFMFTWKNGILPGKVIENQWKSLKNFMCHVKLNLNMKTLMNIWLKASLCHYIWDQIGETMHADLHSRASCYIVADSWTTCYIVAVKPPKQHMQGKHHWSKLPASDCFWWGPCGAENYTLQYREKKSNKYQANLSSINSANMYAWLWCFQWWTKQIHSIALAFWYALHWNLKGSITVDPLFWVLGHFKF